MNYDNIKDYRAQKYFKKFINESGKNFKLRTFLSCGRRPTKPENGISILSNGVHSRIFGAKMCGNSWACPVCSAIKMSRAATRISAALDALKETHYGIMITFTVFHSKNDTCKEVFDLLFKTWSSFISNRQDGAYAKFLSDLNIKHYVRCSEVTFSENGWHPHMHVLYFVPKENFESVLAYEKSLRERWRDKQSKAMKKIYGYVKYNAFYESEVEHGEGAAGVFISKSNEKPIIQKSSDYIAGWGADKELTGNYLKEATSKTSKTPYQLLYAAIDGDQMAKNLYLEFAEYIITNKRRRFDFSRTGLAKIITQYMNTEIYKEVLKKKRTQYLEGKAAWHQVIWFSSEQWYEICSRERELDFSLITLILALARYDDGYELITEVLALYKIEPTARQDSKGFYDSIAKMLNTAA